MPRSLKHISHRPVCFSFLLQSVSLSEFSSEASDASEHCVTLAVAAVVDVDLETWQLLRVQLVLSFPADNCGLDNAWSLRQEPNLPVCRSQVNKTGEQWRESAVLLIWFGCRLFSAFHTQVILGIFFGVGGKGKADYTVAHRVLLCVRDSAGLWVNGQLWVCTCVHAYFGKF